MVIRWTTNAQLRIIEIYNFYQEKSLRVAQSIVDDIYNAVLPLQNFPRMASVEPFLTDYSLMYRSLLVRNLFKIIYYINEENKEIVIVSVWDCRRNPEELQKDIQI